MASQTHGHVFKLTGWGWAAAAATEQALVCVILPCPSRALADAALRRAMAGRELTLEARAQAPLLAKCVEQLDEYFAGRRQQLELPLELAASTPFQQAVWRVTAAIPFGVTRSYGWVAAAAGHPRASRAVGMALNANPFPPFIPCHRVIKSDGSLGGFGAGCELKRRLLALEGAAPPK